MTIATFILALLHDALSHFLGATGASIQDLKEGIDNAEFLGFVLDFVLMSDALVVDVAAAANVPPEAIARARQTLPGGSLPNWT